MNLLFFILICYGLTQILVYGKILDQIRPKHHFFHCPMCVGFHVGWIVCLLSYHTNIINFNINFVTAVLLGFLSSGTSYVLIMLFGDNGLNIKTNL